MRVIPAILAVTTTLSVAGVQNHFVMPARFANLAPRGGFHTLTSPINTQENQQARLQMVWDTAAIPIQSGSLKALSFRRCSGDSAYPYNGGTGHCRVPTVPIPALPDLQDTWLFDQAVFMDPQANAMGLFFLSSSIWTIGSAKPRPCSYIYKSRVTKQEVLLAAGHAPVIKFTY